MQIVTQFPHEITDEPDMAIVMPDGCRLSARVWMPVDATSNSVPAIIEYIPYRKSDGTIARDEPMHRYFAGRGYAVLRIDMRGNGDSAGLMADEYTATELADAVAAIGWIADQEWCDGNVGMMGKSWGGFNGLQVAALAPPQLKAIITVCSSVDRYADDIHYKGGCLLGDNFSWGAQMLSYSSRPPDPMVVGEKWREMWLERLKNQPLLAADWLGHQHRDAYWKHGSVCEDYHAIKAAVLSIGGWADNYMNTVAHLLENLDVPVKGIVGPWVHQYPHQASPEPRIGFLQEAVRWWDHWLKGVANGVDTDPAYRVWRQETVRPERTRKARAGHWQAEADWPSDRVTPHALALSAGGILGGKGGALSVAVNSPMDCGLGTGRYFPMSGDVPELPGDQRDDDARSACFDMPVAVGGLDILGAPVVRLKLASDRPHAQIAVRLCEVHPDGASNRITYGLLNLCHRHGHDKPSHLRPGEAFEIRLDLDQIAYRVKPGMILRLAVSTAYWPFVWPVAERATVTLLGGALELPVHGGTEGDEWQFDEAESARPWAHESLRAPSYHKAITSDLGSGEVSVEMVDDGGLNEDAAHGLQSGHVTRETHRIHPDDPLCASASAHWTQEIRRGDWAIRTETFSNMWSDAEAFHVSGRIEAYEGEKLLYSRDLNRKIPRDCC